MSTKINIPETGSKRIVVVGGGFAGLALVRKLARSKEFQVVMIDRNNYHQFQPLFYQVAMAGLEPSSIVFPFRKIFQNQKNIFIRVTEVISIDLERKRIHTPLGICNYDYLVLATGAETNYFGNQQLEDRAISMKTVSEALYLRNSILADYETALSITDFEERQKFVDIVIVGGGPTGVEVAGALAEMKKYIFPKDYPELDCKEIDIWLIQGGDKLLNGMSENASSKALKYLKELGVEVKLNTIVENYDGKSVQMNDGTSILAKKVIWAAGIKGAPPEGLPKDALHKSNRILVNTFNQVVGMDSVYAIGDVAFMASSEYPFGHPQLAQVAIQQGRLLAKNLISMKNGQPMKPFRYKDLGSMATVGRNRAVVDLPRWKFSGFFAWLAWLLVHLFQILGVKNKLFVFLNWVWNYFTYDQSLRLIIRPKINPKAGK